MFHQHGLIDLFYVCNSTFIAEIKDEKARAQPVDGGSKKGMEKGGNGVDSNNAKAEKTTKLGAATEGKSGASKGKVKDFVQIFNQDADLRTDVDARGSWRWGNVGIEASSNQAKVQEKVDVDKKPDVPFKVLASIHFLVEKIAFSFMDTLILVVIFRRLKI